MRGAWLLPILTLGACHSAGPMAVDCPAPRVIVRHVPHVRYVPRPVVVPQQRPATKPLPPRDRVRALHRADMLRAEMARLQADDARLRAMLQREHEKAKPR